MHHLRVAGDRDSLVEISQDTLCEIPEPVSNMNSEVAHLCTGTEGALSEQTKKL
jgi:hypothetical protein